MRMIVGSAPGFPHGIIDPIEELGELACSYGVCLHVDLCLVTEWSGGLYVSPTTAGSRPGGLIAGAWAALMPLGLEGATMYLSLVAYPKVPLNAYMTIVAIGSNDLDIFEVNDIMTSKGWHLNALQRPNSIHSYVTLQHAPVFEDYLGDLRESVRTVKENPGPISGGLAQIYGAAGKIPDRGMVG
ncbi:hypothetical protein SADUNF_Sadunf01G0045000 [Salix dunnii]|uniref:Sphingosine-1-phosphate lyase n=1 Tax=Salix dunnii TaxID=1413687 RepID=A0A835N9Z6_9ROSI|nr:hypothetical protein SADUNF_Sadunf01G0045000 [Salix dunnii]